MTTQPLNELTKGLDNLIQVLHFCSEDLKIFLDSTPPEQIAEKYRKIEEIKKMISIELEKIKATEIDFS